MNKIRAVILGVILFMEIPLMVMASGMWSGKEVYCPDKIRQLWEIKASEIEKVSYPGAVYSIDDFLNHSAYITNHKEYIGAPLEGSFYWYNTSRLGYIKLIKVTPGQEISFLFSEEKYVYCAEYDKEFKLLYEGHWMTTGDKHSLDSKTEWIMLVFRNATGDLSEGGGQEYVIKADDIQNLKQKYLILEPFTYTFRLNGGIYNGSRNSFTMERLGVSKMTLPVPERAGYIFSGWKAPDGRVYNGIIPVEYNQTLFGHAALDAMWSEITPTGIMLNKTDIVLEEKSNESVQLTATVVPSNALNSSVVWSSSNTDVATVTSNGIVKPVSSGKAIITVKSANGITASCTVYVMGFQISLPEYCSLNESYEIKIEVFNNGNEGSEGRKHIRLNSDNSLELIRVGDEESTYKVFCETAGEYGGNYNKLENSCVVDTMETVSVFYRLKAEQEIVKNGDYEGNLTFNVSVE